MNTRTPQEQLAYAEAQWKEALQKNELYDVMYWRGMIDGLKVRNTTTVNQYGENCTHIENSGTLNISL